MAELPLAAAFGNESESAVRRERDRVRVDRPGERNRSLQGLQRRIGIKRTPAISEDKHLQAIGRECGCDCLGNIQRAGGKRTGVACIDDINLIRSVQGIGEDCSGSVIGNASTFPVTVPSPLNGLLLVPKFVGFTTKAPKSLPIKALSPARSKSSRIGRVGYGSRGAGRTFSCRRSYRCVVQVDGARCAHPVLVASRSLGSGAGDQTRDGPIARTGGPRLQRRGVDGNRDELLTTEGRRNARLR